jgi:hypothetical protein
LATCIFSHITNPSKLLFIQGLAYHNVLDGFEVRRLGRPIADFVDFLFILKITADFGGVDGCIVFHENEVFLSFGVVLLQERDKGRFADIFNAVCCFFSLGGRKTSGNLVVEKNAPQTIVEVLPLLKVAWRQSVLYF